MTQDMVLLAKPAGVRVHGPGDTLDTVMRTALKFGDADRPKLVHRLDQRVSGAMVIARNADAAVWLSACFSDKALKAVASDEEGGGKAAAPGGLPEGLSVKRVYWAFVAGQLQARLSGRIRHPVVVDGKFYPAVTNFRVKASGGGVSWVELIPETGRRHQLRVHCAQFLKAPIIGDDRYGFEGLSPKLPLRADIPSEWWQLFGEPGRGGGGAPLPQAPIMLHARSIVVHKPGKEGVKAIAPLPRYVWQLIDAMGWPAPRD